VNRFVVDASVALKWVIAEAGSSEASALLRADQLIAPDLLVAECANALWKMVRRGEITIEEALMAAQVLERSEIELRPMRGLLAEATRLATTLDHPAYDCIYLALAELEACPFVTADERFVRKLAASESHAVAPPLTLAEAAKRVSAP
jgi:predicted nucleic acid-binding protein